MSWEKIGVTVVSAPVAHGAGIYLRIPKRVVQAYDLITALEIEITLERARRQEKEEVLHGSNKLCNKDERG